MAEPNHTTEHHLRLAPRFAAALAAVALLLSGAATPLHAETVVLNGTFDGLVDGFPGIAPLDGTADVAGNALAVGLKAGVTEEHGVGEFSLAPLGGASSGDVTSATLTFNIDDILSTFGPGTDFDGTAGERIFVRTYSGDGAVSLDDFGRGDQVATVTPGNVTDASLGSSGPLQFDVDVTAAVKSLLDGGDSHLGIVFVTDDSPTGTSLDDLGIGSSGPPGVGGAAMPFVTVEIDGGGPAPTPSPTPGGGPTPRPTASPSTGPTPTIELDLISTRPDGTGDQALYFFDRREGFTTFLTVRNESAEDLVVEMQFYGPEMGEPFLETIPLVAGAAQIIDIGALAGRGLTATHGLAAAHAVGPSGEPLVSRAITGSFTVANLQTNSSWGAPAPARLAVQLAGAGAVLPPHGTMIDGESVLFRAIRPEALVLPLYFNPDTLDPAEIGGHQLIFLSFNDVAGDTFRAQARGTTWEIDAHKSDGTPLPLVERAVEGVFITDIVSALGEGSRGSSGGARFDVHPGGAYNRLIFFTQSLSAFGSGQLLPEAGPE
jgi:hypothetical protein